MRYPRLETRRFTRLEYDRLIEQGFFDEDERIELLDGQLVVCEPQGSRHAVAVDLVRNALQRTFGKGYYVRGHSPVALDDLSEPEPDIAVVRGRLRDYTAAHPASPVLVVEVADSSLGKDRVRKAALYARAGIADYWIVNLNDRVLEVYRGPARSAAGRWKYRSVSLLRARASVSPLAAPGRRVAVAALLP
jgi:Uma2 family endonuclease